MNYLFCMHRQSKPRRAHLKNHKAGEFSGELKSYQRIMSNYIERRWDVTPADSPSAGKFVYRSELSVYRLRSTTRPGMFDKVKQEIGGAWTVVIDDLQYADRITPDKKSPLQRKRCPEAPMQEGRPF
jgi:hypothetical protein